ncbi:MAG: gamma-glutamyl kinase [Paracoccaceae bacterium]
MMVFYKERLAFLSVPKTGTTAYQDALRHRADLMITEPPEIKHVTVRGYSKFVQPIYSQLCDTNLELMAVMRHPVSWLGSWWRYRQRPFMEGHPKATHDISFDDFVLAYLKGKRPLFANVGNQANFLKESKNSSGVTHLFRYEDQDQILAFLNERLDFRIETKKLNVSPSIPLTLSPEIEQKYRRKFSADFELYESIPNRA